MALFAGARYDAVVKDQETNSASLLPDKTSGFTQVSSSYAEKFPLRAAIQAIPWVGGSIDTLFAGVGAKWQYDRLDKFLKVLHERLGRIEKLDSLEAIQPSEPLYDFTMRVFDHVLRTRSDEKRRRFAAIVAHQVQHPLTWDEADAMTRLLGDLSDLHVDILVQIKNAPLLADPFHGLRVVKVAPIERIEDRPPHVTNLRTLLPGINLAALQLACSELAARGLLHDEGVGRVGVSAMTCFIATQLADDFLKWIDEGGD